MDKLHKQLTVIGIDPGIKGAIAIVRGPAVTLFDMPTYGENVGKKRRKAIDSLKLARILLGNVRTSWVSAVVFVEHAQASTQMGVTSSFRYGFGAGIIDGVAAAMGVDVVHVSPRKWKGTMGLTIKGNAGIGEKGHKRDKASSIELARNIFPGMASHLTLKSHDGRADALLIAHYGCKQLGL